MNRICVILLAVLMTSCQSGSFYTREVRALVGQSETRLVAKFGSPAHDHTFTVAQLAHSPEPWHQPIPEVLSMYPTDVEANLMVPIKRLSWPRGRILLTTWLHEKQGHWITLYAEEWNMEVIE